MKGGGKELTLTINIPDVLVINVGFFFNRWTYTYVDIDAILLY